MNRQCSLKTISEIVCSKRYALWSLHILLGFVKSKPKWKAELQNNILENGAKVLNNLIHFPVYAWENLLFILTEKLSNVSFS